MIRQRNALARSWFEKIDPTTLARRSDGLPTVWRANVEGIPFFIRAAEDYAKPTASAWPTAWQNKTYSKP